MENFTSISFCIFILLVSHDQRELNERYIVINMMLNMLIILEENFYINNIQKKNKIQIFHQTFHQNKFVLFMFYLNNPNFYL